MREDRILLRKSTEDRFKTSTQIASEVKEEFQKDLSTRTVRRRLKEVGMKARRPAKKPLLTKRMKENRLNWAKDKKDWTEADWSRVIFSDESKFNLIGPDGSRTVYRRQGERYAENCIMPTVKHSPYWMIWGCISKHKPESLMFVEGTVNAEKYKDIIQKGLVPSLESLTEYEENPIFQDDSAPCHRARTVSNP